MIADISYKPIGIIHSPFSDTIGVPIQPSGAKGIKGTIELMSEFAEGLRDLEGFSHIILIYHLHLSTSFSLKVKPFLDDQLRRSLLQRNHGDQITGCQWSDSEIREHSSY
jgi:tRNA (Thr-GGU) A37 N-methylase